MAFLLSRAQYSLAVKRYLVRPRIRVLRLDTLRNAVTLRTQAFDIEQDLLRRAAVAVSQAYQRYGHYQAQLDPLGLRPTNRQCPELDAASYLPSSSWMDKPLDPSSLSTFNLPSTVKTLSDLDAYLRRVYCGPVGFEFAHLDDPKERQWLTHRVSELFGRPVSDVLSPSERLNAAILMLQAETFEAFLARKFPSFKRYSGEGAEGMQAALDAIFRNALALGVHETVVGMAHRGRLAFLVSQLNFPARRLFYKIPGRSELDPSEFEGAVDDVTSHLAASVDKVFPALGVVEVGDEKRRHLHISLLHNPSHLELVGAAAAGKVRAKNDAGSKALCLQVHGDAAMSGQGVIQETLALSQLSGFRVGGSVHLVVNNQVGFTTEEGDSRSTHYCTDVAKMTSLPIIHVNGESIDQVLLACKLGVEFRQRFHRDVVIDLVVYRKHGHNEVDEPSFTQPVMYREVRRAERPSPAQSYAAQLMQEGLLTPDRMQKLRQTLEAHLDGEFEASQNYDIKAHKPDYLGGKWSKLRHAKGEDVHRQILTGAPVEVLHHVGLASVTLPLDLDDNESFRIHERLERTFVGARLKMLDEGRADWATAEALAVGSLLAQGFDVRLCGQDVQRGTFSQRHFVLTDQETGARYCPLAHVPGSRGKLHVVNSNLSELAVLAFELGYSWEDPRNMVVWEAQFGDFANGAQMVIDTFLTGSEAKWLRQTGLVMLLPHGYDGAGPEHSSCRLERFLQLCDAPGVAPAHVDVAEETNTNLVVVNPSTPANYFHVLRRQQLRPFRKPMVVVAPKTILRHPSAVSTLDEMNVGTSFHPLLITDARGSALPSVSPDTSTIILCTGKVYYDLTKALADEQTSHVAVIRVEELVPFPAMLFRTALQERFPAAKTFMWVQEEPLNAGAWAFVHPHIERALRVVGEDSAGLLYIGMVRGQQIPGTGRSSSVTAGVAGSLSCAMMELCIFHGLDTGGKRIMTYNGRLLTANAPIRVKKQMLEEVIFRESVNASWPVRVRSLFPGFKFAIMYKIAQRTITYGCQPLLNDYLNRNHAEALRQAFGRWTTPMTYGLAGGLMGTLEVVVLPADTLKIIAQTNNNALGNRSTLEIVRTEGFKLYRGWQWTAARNFPGSFGMFGGSALAKEFLQLDNYVTAHTGQEIFASGVGAALSLTLSSPFDVIKARVQKSSIDSHMTGLQHLQKLLAVEGPWALFKGLPTKMAIVGPKVTIGFTIAQQVMAATDRWLTLEVPQLSTVDSRFKSSGR